MDASSGVCCKMAAVENVFWMSSSVVTELKSGGDRSGGKLHLFQLNGNLLET